MWILVYFVSGVPSALQKRILKTAIGIYWHKFWPCSRICTSHSSTLMIGNGQGEDDRSRPPPINTLPQNYFLKVSSTHDTIDKVQQSITIALQQIDRNFSDCHKAALSFYQELSQYHALQLETQKALSVRHKHKRP